MVNSKVRSALKWILHHVPFLQSIRKRYQTEMQNRAIAKERAYLQANGKAILNDLHALLTKSKVPYFAEYGTLLGLIREGGFIKHDEDIDLGVLGWSVDPVKLMEVVLDHGLLLKRAFCWNGQITEFTFLFNNKLQVDFFFLLRGVDGKEFGVAYNDFTEDESGRRIAKKIIGVPKPKFSGVSEYTVNGITTYIPQDYEGFLICSYGKNWRTPIENFQASRERVERKDIEGIAYILTTPEEVREVMAASKR